MNNATENTFKTRSNVMSMTGYQVLEDDEIFSVSSTTKTLATTRKCEYDCAEKGPYSEETFNCLETAMRWLEQQEECDAIFKAHTTRRTIVFCVCGRERNATQ
ncbi:hypothetical protein AVEN_115036-1 [Araneus ventricosus]|uniref:Uncharacterized protein n=1 Tax=Araneus ventricosus TaxID=182803 RepID=A0A4Y1ZX80_ARAVE|nr:hypothetical protein AVEN_115036-1 [Araneus ventricosus]